MASVTVTAEAQECIANGTVLVPNDVPSELILADGSEELRLRIEFLADEDASKFSNQVGVEMHQVDEKTAVTRFFNLRKSDGLPVTFGPIAAATFNGRALSFLFQVRYGQTAAAIDYSFWLRAA